MIAASILLTFPEPAQAANTYPGRTIVIPNDGDTNYTNAPWVFFYNADTGDMYHATLGTVSTTYGDCDILSVVHGTNTGVYTIAVPPLEKQPRIAMMIMDTATPGTSAVPTQAVLYDQKYGVTYSDANPATGARVRTLGR
jgi:hypothetical protein